jgi:hypothetical protein
VDVDSPVPVKIGFKCLHPGTALVELVLTPSPPFQPYRPMSVFVHKVCGGSSKPGLAVGLTQGGSDIVSNGKLVGKMHDVESLTDTTRLYTSYTPMSIDDPDAELQPTLKCVGANPWEANPTVQTVLTAGTETGSFDIFYACQHKGVSQCTFSLGLKFWKDPGISWKKVCGGIRQDIDIQSDLETYSNVFTAGKAATAWLPNFSEVKLPVEEDFLTFTLHKSATAAATEPIILKGGEVEVSPKDALEVSLEQDLSGRVLGSATDNATVKVKHVCKGHGDVNVTVRFPIDGHVPKPLQLALLRSRARGGAGPGIDDKDWAMPFAAPTLSYKKSCGIYHFPEAWVIAAFAGIFFLISATCSACVVKKHWGLRH